jgi:hypothetical protein
MLNNAERLVRKYVPLRGGTIPLAWDVARASEMAQRMMTQSRDSLIREHHRQNLNALCREYSKLTEG